MLGFVYGEQDRKAAVLYEYETFKAIEGELLLDTYIRYLQVINDLKKCGYSKDNCELNFKFLNNLQPKWKQYATMMRQNKNLMDININTLYNILKQNQGDVNNAMGSKKKTVVVTSDPLALIAEKTNVSRSKEKVVVSLDSKGSEADDFSELKKITAFLKCLIVRAVWEFFVELLWIVVQDKMIRDVITVGSIMRIPLLYRGEYLQWRERFMNYLEEETDGEAMLNCIQNEKKTRKIDRLSSSLLIEGLPNDIYSLIDSNKTAKDLWDALERQMHGSKNGDVNDALGYKKKAVVVTLDPLALVAEKTNVSKQKEKVVISSDSEGSGSDDFSELKKITVLLAKAFN
nr:hypothetical protein [Tanacetum cinerariifolium]